MTVASLLGSILTECRSGGSSNAVSFTAVGTILPTMTTAQTFLVSTSTRSVVNSSTTSSATGSNGLSGGTIGGIAGGIAGGFLIVGALLFWYIRRHEMKHSTNETVTRTAPIRIEIGGSLEYEPKPETTEPDMPSGRIRYPDPQEEEGFGAEGGRLSRPY